MLTSLIATVGKFAHLKFDFKKIFSGFLLKQQVQVSLTCQGSDEKRKYFAEEHRTAIGRINVELIPPVNDPRGMNTQVIDENGEVTLDLLAAKLKQSGGITRTYLTDIQALVTGMIRQDSQISLLVSMLSTIFTLAYKESDTPLTLRKYDDGHVKMELIDEISDRPVHARWYDEAPIPTHIWQQANMDNNINNPTINVAGFNLRDTEIIVAHLGARHRTTRLAFDLEIPKLTRRGVSLVSDIMLDDSFTTLQNVGSEEVRKALDKYVMQNRLQGAFEAALAIYHQVAFTPLPDCAEGYVWLKRKRTLVLPEFDAFRGAFSILLRELPFGLDASVQSTWKWWREVGMATAIPASTITAYSLWGRYLAESKFYHDDANIDHLGGLHFGENPGAAYYCYASLITGQDVYCPIPRSLGLKFDAWNEDTEFELPVTILDVDAQGYHFSRTRENRDYLVVKSLPPPCSAVSVLGKMPRDGAFSALSDKYTVQLERFGDGWFTKNVNSAWGIAMAARWAGWDVEMCYRREQRLANWAPNSSSIASRPFNVNGVDKLPVEITSFRPRRRRFMELPEIHKEVNEWTVTVAVSDNVALFTHDNQPVRTTGVFYAPSGPGVNVVRPPDENMSYVPLVIRSFSRADVKASGFRIVGQEPPPQPPDPIKLDGPAVGAEQEEDGPILQEAG